MRSNAPRNTTAVSSNAPPKRGPIVSNPLHSDETKSFPFPKDVSGVRSRKSKKAKRKEEREKRKEKRAKRKEERGKSKEQRAKNKEERGKRKEERASARR